MNSPYEVGGLLELRLVEDDACDKHVQVRIEKLYTPCTLSCVMEVTILDSRFDVTTAVLKMYDWRYAEQLRKDQGLDPWSPETEKAYVEFVRSGGAKEFVNKLRTDDDFDEPEEGWSPGELEAYAVNICTEMFGAETTVYQKLSAHQGQQIPRFIASVESGLPFAVQLGHNASEFTKVFGILLEHVSGFTLAELDETKAPRSSWKTIVDQAIKNIHIFSDNGILNADVRASNVLISPSSSGEYRVSSIDFAQCKMRREGESDSEWGRAKWTQDEEGAVGVVMRSRLAKQGFKLEYEPSYRYLEWAEKEDE